MTILDMEIRSSDRSCSSLITQVLCVLWISSNIKLKLLNRSFNTGLLTFPCEVNNPSMLKHCNNRPHVSRWYVLWYCLSSWDCFLNHWSPINWLIGGDPLTFCNMYLPLFIMKMEQSERFNSRISITFLIWSSNGDCFGAVGAFPCSPPRVLGSSWCNDSTDEPRRRGLGFCLNRTGLSSPARRISPPSPPLAGLLLEPLPLLARLRNLEGNYRRRLGDDLALSRTSQGI
nr:hypothetical protein Iba_chr05eCG6520 [Ipomoea batatas]